MSFLQSVIILKLRQKLFSIRTYLRLLWYWIFKRAFAGSKNLI